MRRTIGYLAVVVGFLMMPARSTAQPLECPHMPKAAVETMTSWMDRCGRQEERARAEEAARADNEARKRAIGQQLAETDRQQSPREAATAAARTGCSAAGRARRRSLRRARTHSPA